jgi:hypothetical protein
LIKFNLFTVIFSDVCSACNGDSSLCRSYFKFISTQLIPELKKNFSEHEEYWIFKPESSLYKYIKEQRYVMTLYFKPSELIDIVESIAETNGLYDPGNLDIIILNKELQSCFNAWCIFKPNLYSHCLPHVNLANNEKINEIRNHALSSEFYLDSPVDIIYNDTSSLFWVSPMLNLYIYNNKKIIYTWKELCTQFTQFVTNQHSDFSLLDNDIYCIKKNSILSQTLKFSHFHKSQIPYILKQFTKFLGKSTTLLTLCKNLKLHHVNSKDKISAFIENIILNNNALTPYVPSVVYL